MLVEEEDLCASIGLSFGPSWTSQRAELERGRLKDRGGSGIVSVCHKNVPKKVLGRSCELEKPRGTFMPFGACSE